MSDGSCRELTVEQRLARRAWLLAHLDDLQRAMVYAREFRDDLGRPGAVVWRPDEDEGRCCVSS